MMEYAVTTTFHCDTMKAKTWINGQSAILTFEGDSVLHDVGLHVPPPVAVATAEAFNKAMQEHIAATESEANNGECE